MQTRGIRDGATGWSRCWRLAALVLLLGLLVGCARDELYSQLSEEQANDVVAALLNHGIDARKEAAPRDAGWQVTVQREDVPAAVAILHDAGLPRQNTDNISQMFKKSGAFSSPLEDKNRFIFAREQLLAAALRKLDGVVDASVNLSIPDKSMTEDKPEPGSASVMVIARPNAGIESRAADIKAIVMNGTDQLTDPSKVSVQFFQRAPSEISAPVPQHGGVFAGGMRGDVASLLLIGFAVLAVVLAGVLVWRNRHALMGRPQSKALVRREAPGER